MPAHTTSDLASWFRTLYLKELWRRVGCRSAGRPVALYGSAGYLEIAYNGDRADTRLNMGIGIIVNVAVEPKGA